MDNIFACDLCKTEIIKVEVDLFHVTAYIDGEVNRHTHLCSSCFSDDALEPIELDTF